MKITEQEKKRVLANRKIIASKEDSIMESLIPDIKKLEVTLNTAIGFERKRFKKITSMALTTVIRKLIRKAIHK